MAVEVDDLSGARRRFQISWKLLNGIIGNHECKGVLLSTCYDLANNRAIHGFGITRMVIPHAPIFMRAIELGQLSAVSRTDRLKRFAREQSHFLSGPGVVNRKLSRMDGSEMHLAAFENNQPFAKFSQVPAIQRGAELQIARHDQQAARRRIDMRVEKEQIG